MKQRIATLLLGFASLGLFALGAADGGSSDTAPSRDVASHGGSDARGRASGSGADDPSPVTENGATVVGPADKPPEKITPEVAKGMLAEFMRAQGGELKALDHRNKLELREIKTSQGVRQKEWEKHEQTARHAYFAEHTRGPERRAYVRDFEERWRVFRQQLKDEYAERLKDQDTRLANLREEQGARLKTFKEYLGRNERPPVKLWPGS